MTPESRRMENRIFGAKRVAEIPTVADSKIRLVGEPVASPNPASTIVLGVPGMVRDREPFVAPGMLTPAS